MAADSLSDIEEWRPVPGYEGWYSVSSHGRVRRDRGGNSNTHAGKILKPSLNRKHRYFYVGLCVAGVVRLRRVNQLVCLAFHGPQPGPEYEAAHWDGNRQNNRKDNLRWATYDENRSDMERHGTVVRGERHGAAKLTADDIREIRRLALAGRSRQEIAKHFGLSGLAHIGRIVRGVAWKHIE